MNSGKIELFRKSRSRIILVIMLMLTMILASTIGIIYYSTYRGIYIRDQQILSQFIESRAMNPLLEPHDASLGNKAEEANASIIYMVKFNEDGVIERVWNDIKPIMPEDELKSMAEHIKNLESAEGIYGNYLYRLESVDGCTFAAFMNNTLFKGSVNTLFWNAVISGAIAMIVLFLFSCYISGRIVAPMEESYKKQKQFISDAGHELKTPISAIGANAELLKKGLSGSPEEQKRWLDNIIYENKRMKELVTELLDLARTENTVPSMEELDISRLITGEVLPLEAAAFEKGIMIETDIEPEILLMGNSPQLSQLVSTLIDNALSHIETEREGLKAIKVKLSKEKGYAVLRVMNPGVKIPEDERDKIFERFYRQDESRNLNGHYGLGLAIAKAITLRHNGRIDVDHYDGCNVFTVHLPLY